MKNKFWVYYLTLVLFLSGLTYVAISDVSDVPLALSDSEMAALHAAGITNQRCMRANEPGCDNSACDEEPTGIATYGQRYNDCEWYNGWKCNWWGPDDAQVLCRNAIYSDDCSKFDRIELDTSANCNSSLM